MTHPRAAQTPKFLWIACSLAFSACAVDDAGSTDAEMLAEDGTGGSNSDGPLAEPTLARGISIDEVEVNQGTRIPVGVGADWIDGPDRSGYLIASRDSLIRVHFSVDEDWIPREIEARMTLGFADGTSSVLSQTKLIEASSQPYSLDGTFWFGLIADDGQTVTGTTYQIELWEVDGDAGAELDEGLAVNPAAGPQLIGFEAVPMQIKLVMVPIEYNGKVPVLDEAIQQDIVDRLYEQNPATEILWDVHEVVPYDSNLTDLGLLLPVMSQLRAAEAADPNLYYHALVDVGGVSIGGTLGISNLAGDSKADSGSRVSATVLWVANPSVGAETFTHETGHAQGLNHVECPNGGAAGPDPLYPHENGRIGNWGFGIRRFVMFDPDDAYDYMSYCSPSWVSDWTWNKTYKRIKTLTAWDFEGGAASDQPVGTLLIGARYRDGSREWWTVPGNIDPEQVSGQDRFEFEIDGERVEGWAEVDRLSDGVTQWVKVELPAAVAEIDAITHVRTGPVEQIEHVDPRALGSKPVITSDWRPRLAATPSAPSFD